MVGCILYSYENRTIRRCDSSDVSALQAWSPEFKPQSHKKGEQIERKEEGRKEEKKKEERKEGRKKENGTLKPVEIVLRRGEGRRGRMTEGMNLRYTVNTYVNVTMSTPCTTIIY
jgi:hypothetical protein